MKGVQIGNSYVFLLNFFVLDAFCQPYSGWMCREKLEYQHKVGAKIKPTEIAVHNCKINLEMTIFLPHFDGA
jgi:hypothetical protein